MATYAESIYCLDEYEIHESYLKGILSYVYEICLSSNLLVRLELKNRLSSPKPGFASRIGRSGFFFILVKVSLVPRVLPLFYISFVAGKRTFICDYTFSFL